jgi:DNA-binding NtrC family response regulator
LKQNPYLHLALVLQLFSRYQERRFKSAGGGKVFMIYEEVSILIVEDDSSTRKSLADHLGESFSCATASSAEEAMELFQTGSFNLVLTDMVLPGANGIELGRFVMANHPYTQVILMSASARLELEVEAARQRVFEYLGKPFSLSLLDQAISRALRYQAFSKKLSGSRKQPLEAKRAASNTM